MREDRVAAGIRKWPGVVTVVLASTVLLVGCAGGTTSTAGAPDTRPAGATTTAPATTTPPTTAGRPSRAQAGETKGGAAGRGAAPADGAGDDSNASDAGGSEAGGSPPESAPPNSEPAGRSTVDRPDDSTEAQVKVMYVVPSDGTDRQMDVDGRIERSISSTQTWLSAQSGGTKLRYDTAGGRLDITFVRLGRSDKDLASTGLYLRDAIEQDLKGAGFNAPNKLYAVFYDGTAKGACGGGAWPPKLVGKVAAEYLRGDVSPAPPCESNPVGSSADQPGYIDIAMLHEVLHTLGGVAECAPHHTRDGHVSDTPDDLLYAGDAPWTPKVLDAGRDDYWGHGRPDCLDLATSAFMDPRPAGAAMPPGWPAG